MDKLPARPVFNDHELSENREMVKDIIDKYYRPIVEELKEELAKARKATAETMNSLEDYKKIIRDYDKIQCPECRKLTMEKFSENVESKSQPTVPAATTTTIITSASTSASTCTSKSAKTDNNIRINTNADAKIYTHAKANGVNNDNVNTNNTTTSTVAIVDKPTSIQTASLQLVEPEVITIDDD